jgi:phosphoribosyl-ATP pyrophosphohydrolase
MIRFTLSDLEKIIEQRAAASSEESYTAKLIEKGIAVSSKKLGEEAVETVIAANRGDKTEIISQIPVADVMRELETRTQQSGLAEKASRSGQK